MKSDQILCVYAAFRFLLGVLCNPKMAVVARRSPYGVSDASSCDLLHAFRSNSNLSTRMRVAAWCHATYARAFI